MRWLIDVQGTLLGREDGADQQAVQAAVDLHEVGEDVVLVSSSPRQPIDGLAVCDKLEVLQSATARGAIVVDDDRSILACATRLGAIAVPAAAFLPLAWRVLRARHAGATVERVVPLAKEV